MACRLFTAILTLLVMLNGVKAQSKLEKEKFIILIPSLQQDSSSGIIVTEAEMTELIFGDLTGLNHFDVKLVAEDNAGENNYDPDVLISGSYSIIENLISLNYTINLKKTKTKLIHSLDNAELPAIKKAILKDVSSIVTNFQIESDPPGAKISMDGKEIGETPSKTITGLIGTHTFELRKDGFYGLIQDMEITGPKTFKFTLQPEIRKSLIADDPPQPAGGMTKLRRKVRYPEMARKLGIEGKVIIKVIIDADGSIVKTEVLKSIGNNGTTEAVIKAVRETKWKPGKIKNKPVKSSATVIIQFKIPR